MLGLYFSGTGNTQYCVEKFVSKIEQNALCFSIEDHGLYPFLENEAEIVFGYPIQFSNIPIYVRDFIKKNHKLFAGKNIFIIATMGLFSGDGAGCSARIFKKYGVNVSGVLHLKMPDCIGDSALLKKSSAENKQLILNADKKMKIASRRFLDDKPTQEGLNIFSHIAGLFGQRLWFSNKTKSYKEKPDIDIAKCIGCEKCVSLCPTDNLFIQKNKATRKNQCTMCYRCVNFCPAKALTILGKEVVEQVYLGKYISEDGVVYKDA